MVQPQQQQQPAVGGGVRLLQAGLPIGFRFRPTDEELLLHYLRRKALSYPVPAGVIPVADLARLHPWDLPGDADGERYFFHLPATSCRRKGGGASRAAGTGVWRASGKEALVVSPRCGRPVGAKRTLVFCHRGGARTGWVMHEYRLLPAGLADDNPQMSSHAAEAKDWVVCRIFKKTASPASRRRPPCARVTARQQCAANDTPSSPTSCVTENGGDVDEEEQEESSCSVVASNWA